MTFNAARLQTVEAPPASGSDVPDLREPPGR
jgi:hypothetical protein